MDGEDEDEEEDAEEEEGVEGDLLTVLAGVTATVLEAVDGVADDTDVIDVGGVTPLRLFDALPEVGSESGRKTLVGLGGGRVEVAMVEGVSDAAKGCCCGRCCGTRARVAVLSTIPLGRDAEEAV